MRGPACRAARPVNALLSGRPLISRAELVGEEWPSRAKSSASKRRPRASLAQADEAQPAARLAEIMHELGTLRACSRGPTSRHDRRGSSALPRDEVERLASELRLIRSTITGAGRKPARTGRARLRAADDAHRQRTGSGDEGQRTGDAEILAAAEEIDQAANNLSAALKGEMRTRPRPGHPRSRDRDLRGLQFSGSHQPARRQGDGVTRSHRAADPPHARRTRPPRRRAPMHGPRLATIRGHVSQNDVDSMFAAATSNQLIAA